MPRHVRAPVPGGAAGTRGAFAHADPGAERCADDGDPLGEPQRGDPLAYGAGGAHDGADDEPVDEPAEEEPEPEAEEEAEEAPVAEEAPTAEEEAAMRAQMAALGEGL